MNKIKYLFTSQFRLTNQTHLTNRTLLQFSGKDTHAFLQGITSNDITSPNPTQYTLFLSPQGRIVTDAILIKPKQFHNGQYVSASNEIWVDIDTAMKEKLISHIKTYMLRKKIQIEDITSQIYMGALFSDAMKQEKKQGEFLDYLSDGEIEEGEYKNLVYVDPRSPALGLRFVTTDAQLGIDQSIQQVPLPYYTAFRYHQAIAEGREVDNSVPFTTNMDFWGAINLNKGCYIGQELMARTFYQGIVRKRCIPFIVLNSSIIPELDTNFQEQLTGQQLMLKDKVIGKVFQNQYNIGLATVQYLDLDLISDNITIGNHRVLLTYPEYFKQKLKNYIQEVKERN